MENLPSSISAPNSDQEALADSSTLALGTLFSLHPEIRLIIYGFARGDIYTDGNFKSQDHKVADSHMETCFCCKRHIPKPGQEHENFIQELVEGRRAHRHRAFDLYFNLTLVNKAVYFEARDMMRRHYRTQLGEAHQVYYICRIITSKPGAKPTEFGYRLAPHDLWAPERSTASALAALELPKLRLAYCNGGLVKEFGNALRATNATQSLRIHIEEAKICEQEREFLEVRFAWTRQIKDTIIYGRASYELWAFQSDPSLKTIKKDKDREELGIPYVLDKTLTGSLKYHAYESDLYMPWSQFIIDQAQQEFNRVQSLVARKNS